MGRFLVLVGQILGHLPASSRGVVYHDCPTMKEPQVKSPALLRLLRLSVPVRQLRSAWPTAKSRTGFRGIQLCLLLLVGCAKVGAPVPPVSEPPVSTRDLQLVQVADRLQLIFPRPPENIAAVQLHGRCSGAKRPPDDLELIGGFERENLRPYAAAGSLVFVENPANTSATCQFALRLLDRRGRISELSNRVNSTPVSPASPPSNLRSEVRQDRIILRWDRPLTNSDGSAPANVEGYLLNSKHRVFTERFEDLEVEFGQNKTYWIQAISRSQDPLILSSIGDTLVVSPRDTFPPQVPQNVTAVYWKGKVQVLWDRGRDSDLDRYVVYKGTGPESLKRLSRRVSINRFTDEAVAVGLSYYYRVAALDTSGNESPQSAPVRVMITD